MTCVVLAFPPKRFGSTACWLRVSRTGWRWSKPNPRSWRRPPSQQVCYTTLANWSWRVICPRCTPRLGALMGTWRLPLSIVEAVGWHHCPGHSFDQNFSVLTAVHAADVLAYEAAGTNLE